jgi:hypothetical protein
MVVCNHFTMNFLEHKPNAPHCLLNHPAASTQDLLPERAKKYENLVGEITHPPSKTLYFTLLIDIIHRVREMRQKEKSFSYASITSHRVREMRQKEKYFSYASITSTISFVTSLYLRVAHGRLPPPRAL